MKPTQKRLIEAVRGNPDLLETLCMVADQQEHYATGELVDTPDKAYRHLMPYTLGQPNERLVALGLNRRRRLVDTEVLTQGCDSYTIVDPRQIFRWALKNNRIQAIILAHNHPSGDPTPSALDRDVTERVAAAGRVLGVPLLDHLVVGAVGSGVSGRGFVSMSEQGLMGAL